MAPPEAAVADTDAEAGPAATESTDKTSVEMKSEEDPNIVNWDGPDDPKNPRNWGQGFKLLNVLLIGLSILCTYEEILL